MSYHLDCTKLKEGDIIFSAVDNLLYRHVSNASKTWVSHVGIIMYCNKTNQWVVYESTFPFSTKTPIHKFINRSYNNYFSIRRINKPLQIAQMYNECSKRLGYLYNGWFNLNGWGMFCSRFVYEIFNATGITVGKIQTFKELLNDNPTAPLTFWKIYFLGFIPWKRKTVTPESIYSDPQLTIVQENIP